ncbi:MAG TPA: FtsX-like permease family protein [Jatrophihabitans sp.]|nr:FtsX-like permease family protein [Jatrophihabitans sp.]
MPSAGAISTSTLTAIPGVTAVATIHSRIDGGGPAPFLGPPLEYVDCAQLARIPALGHCVPGAQIAIIQPDYGGAVIDKSAMPDTSWPAAQLSGTQLQQLPVATIVVGTDGSSAAIERARTVIDRAYDQTYAPQTLKEYQADNDQKLNSYRRLADVVILTSLPIAGCSLAVSVAGGLAERKRAFSLLRLTGTPLAVLRRVVTLESAAPLLVSAVVAAGTGLLTAQLFLRAQLHETLRLPGPEYYGLVLAGLVLSLAVIASSLPLLNRLNGPETARNE